MDTELQQVSVLVSDLEVIRAALTSAYYQNETMDMVEQYRKLNNRSQPSPMTKALQGAVGKAENYIQLAMTEEEVTDDE